MPDHQKISVLIADDEPVARKLIRHFLETEADFTIVGETGDGLETLNAIATQKPDVVLLDIEMPELSGVELVSHIEPPLPLIVFITAFSEFAVKAFEENALDYILKPFDQERFRKTLSRVKSQFNNRPPVLLDNMSQVLEGLMNASGDRRFLKKISSKQKGKIKFVDVDKIHWIESEGAFCKLHLEHSFEMTNLSIKRLEELLDPETHIRVHKSHMVNVEHIESIEPYFHGEYMLNLKNGISLKLSRGHKDKLDAILNQYK